jgi:hypothetical protein
LRISSLLLLGILYGNEKMEGKRKRRTKRMNGKKNSGGKASSLNP